MIQPIKQNLAFTANNNIPATYDKVAKPSNKQEVAKQAEVTSEMPKNKKTVGQFFHDVKIGLMNVGKGFNNVTSIGSGVLRGAGEGIVAGTVIGTIGTNLLNSKDKISNSIKEGANAAEAVKDFPLGKLVLNTVGGTIKDTFTTLGKVIKHLPDILTKAPIENAGKLIELPGKFVKYVLGNPENGAKAAKSNKILLATSIAIALAIVAFRAVQGKIYANRKNANMDHSLNEGHISTK